MSKEEFLKLAPTPRKENDPMRNVSCPYLSELDMKHTVHINPQDFYLCIDEGMVSILAQLTGEQLKEVFMRLNTCGLNNIYVEPEDKVNPMVAAILNEISRRGLQRGRYIIDCVGETI